MTEVLTSADLSVPALAVGGLLSAVMLRVNIVIFVTPPPMAVTVMGWGPTGVAAAVLIVSVDEQVGVQEGGGVDSVAPEGRPETEKVTGCDVPEE